jgi:predicted nucleotidyltransferase
MNIFRDISGKTDPATIELITDLDAVMRHARVEYIVIGATARDLVFESAFDIRVRRLTKDIDFGIQVAAWVEYDSVMSALLLSKKFTKDAKQKQRFLHHTGRQIDIVPFGGIEHPVGSISWPPDQDVEMSTIGFKEAFQHAIFLRLRPDPEMIIKVCSPSGLAVLKIISWYDRKNTTAGSADAQDLAFLMRHYADVDAIHPAEQEGIRDVPDDEMDYERMSAWLLGRHIASITDAPARERILEILTSETYEKGELRLATMMASEDMPFEFDDTRDTYLRLLRSLTKGIVGPPA